MASPAFFDLGSNRAKVSRASPCACFSAPAGVFFATSAGSTAMTRTFSGSSPDSILTPGSAEAASASEAIQTAFIMAPDSTAMQNDEQEVTDKDKGRGAGAAGHEWPASSNKPRRTGLKAGHGIDVAIP